MHPKSFSEHAERIARRGRSFVGVFDPTLLTISFICASWQWSARRISPQEETAGRKPARLPSRRGAAPL